MADVVVMPPGVRRPGGSMQRATRRMICLYLVAVIPILMVIAGIILLALGSNTVLCWLFPLYVAVSVVSVLATICGTIRNQHLGNQLLYDTMDAKEAAMVKHKRVLWLDANAPARWDRARSAAVDDSCAICLSAMESGDCVRELPCKHRFHSECLADFITSLRPSTKPRCPMCRQGLCDEAEQV